MSSRLFSHVSKILLVTLFSVMCFSVGLTTHAQHATDHDHASIMETICEGEQCETQMNRTSCLEHCLSNAQTTPSIWQATTSSQKTDYLYTATITTPDTIIVDPLPAPEQSPSFSHPNKIPLPKVTKKRE